MASQRIAQAAIVAALAVLGSGCSQTLIPLKAQPTAVSEFLAAQHVSLQRADTSPFHRVWQTSQPLQAAGRRETIMIAPVNTRYLHSGAWWYADEDSARESVSEEIGEIADYVHRQFAKELETQGGYQVVSGESGQPALILKLALVELTPTDIYRNAAGTVLSVFLPGGSLVSVRSSGSIGIEGALIDGYTGKPIFVFADRERAKLSPFSFRDFTYFSHARLAIDEWAEQFALLCKDPRGEPVADSLPFTLNPF